MPLSSFDYAILAAYLLILLTVGLWLRRRASAGLDHYLLAGRATPWWLLGVSGVMDFWDLAGSVIIVSFLYLMGPAGLFIEFRGGAVLILSVVMLWTGKWRRRSECRTGAEWMRFRFGDGPAGRLAQSARALAGIALFIGLVAYATKALAVFLSSIVPLAPSQIGLAVVSLVAAYSVFSGFYGLVAIQGIQFVCVLISTVSVISLAVLAVPPLTELREIAIEVTGNPGWGQLAPGDSLSLPPLYASYEPLLFLATVYLVRNVLFGMGAGDDPKCFAAKRDAECPKLLLLWVSLISLRWPTMMAFAVLAIVIAHGDQQRGVDYKLAAQSVRTHYPDDEWARVVASIGSAPDAQPRELQASLLRTLGENWPQRLAEVTEQGLLDPERLIPVVLERAVPTGLRGLILVSLLAAATAGLSGWLNQAAGLFANDIYLVWFRPRAGATEQIAATWAVVLAVVGLGYLLAFSSRTVNEIWSWLTMGLGSGLIAAQMLPLYWRRFNGVGFAAGLAGGIAAAAAHRIAVPGLPQGFASLNEEWVLLSIVLTAGMAASIVGTLASPMTDASVLLRFYRKTLPFGAWGVERESLTTEQQRELSRHHTRELCALPFALVYQIMIFLSPMLMLIGDWSAAAACGAAAAVAIALLWAIYFSGLNAEAELVGQIQRSEPD
ncbi:Sodium:solute symporter family protein [Posidoniimonas polymericola]|uniref:Sodium:solute symporter family protein n=1 Tax=Posidoniimonas polymericola TaxID=2528002 RepID=A0A5C5YTM4_9BACT|nr:hypothetical protein [Posidoniimonas polymericola]TWT78364.1 Sodium:solute symporter family protein [Posidoniimonas polymericola]